MGTGGHLPSPTRAVHDGPAKEAESISEIRPGRRSECRNFAEIIGAVTVFLFVFGYLAVVTYEATEGLAVPAIHH
ncbi:hypothetical protein Ocin01_00469 [Orchesella cincta]|uniref:Uncharacterized protein n=1 Tax=Orchesella cincta TaxID=48709 RepID=A0A1D2NLQ1_ORCCI|nr:hypothetical protein Ocin01_00469 [Orchesella cincta]